MKKPAKKSFFIATVIKRDYANVERRDSFESARLQGDWASFVSNSKADAIDRALEAREDWERNGHCGPYQIWVGELTEEVKIPRQTYDLVQL